jgi:preprotein translocase subunit SecE
MENRKIIVTSYLVLSAVVWFLSRSLFQWLYLTFYELRRVPSIVYLRELVPVALASIVFIILFRHPMVTSFSDEVVSELRKVTWPSRDDVVKSTTVVLVCVLIASFILAGFDLIWGKVIGFLLHS